MVWKQVCVTVQVTPTGIRLLAAASAPVFMFAFTWDDPLLVQRMDVVTVDALVDEPEMGGRSRAIDEIDDMYWRAVQVLEVCFEDYTVLTLFFGQDRRVVLNEFVIRAAEMIRPSNVD